MQKLRYLLRAGLGLVVLAGMFLVPIIARAEVSSNLTLTINDDAPDGPDPVTTGLDVSFDVRVHNSGGAAGTPEVTAHTEGNHFITWYSNDSWDCNPTGGPSIAPKAVVQAPNLGNDIACDGPTMGPNATSHLHLVVKAPFDAGDFRTDVSVTDIGGFAVIHGVNTTSDFEDTTAEDPTGDNATGFIPPEGGKIKTDGKPDSEDNTNSAIRTLNGSGPGGVFSLDDLQPGDPDFDPNLCGGDNCDGKVVEVVLPDGYNDKQNPPKLKLIFDVTVAGAGEDATIWMKKGNADPVVVPECDIDGIAKPHPCHGPAHTKKNGDVRYTVYLLSTDPIFGKH